MNYEMVRDLRIGNGFISINKSWTLLKILIWDRSGFVIYYSKIPRGTIQVSADDGAEVSMQH